MSDDQGIERKPPVPGRKFIAVNLDGTLAHYDRYRGRDHIGEPIADTVAKVQARMKQGDVVIVFTSRVCDPRRADHETVLYRIHEWTERHLGERLFVTATKFPYFSEIWDHRAVHVPMNAGA